MAEIAQRIVAPGAVLEAFLDRGNGDDAVIVCHPHSLYGGSMDNNVVEVLRKSLSSLGWGTIRFNFRGVGASSGRFDNGMGEAEDILAVASFACAQGFGRIHLAGYSFGAWVGLRAISTGFAPLLVMLISPPIDFLDFTDLGVPSNPCLVTLGDRDSFCSQEALRGWLSSSCPPEGFGPDVKILSGCDHFYWGFESALKDAVLDFVGKSPG